MASEEGFYKGLCHGLSLGSSERAANSLNSLARRTLLPISWQPSFLDCQRKKEEDLDQVLYAPGPQLWVCIDYHDHILDMLG